MNFRSCKPQLKWMTSHFPSPSQLSMLSTPFVVGPQFVRGAVHVGFAFQLLPDGDSIADGNGVANQEDSWEACDIFDRGHCGVRFLGLLRGRLLVSAGTEEQSGGGSEAAE